MGDFYITLENGDRVPFDGAGLGVNAELISADKTLTTEDSGKSFVLSNATGEAITLPAVQTGLNYKFATGLAFITDPWTITATTSVIQGNVTVAGAVVIGAAENTISFVESAESLGDWVEIWSDGTNWYVSGQAALSGAITLTDV